MSAQPAVNDVTPKSHQINLVHVKTLFLQADVLSGTPSVYTSHTCVCESVCEEQNQSTDLCLSPALPNHWSICCW